MIAGLVTCKNCNRPFSVISRRRVHCSVKCAREFKAASITQRQIDMREIDLELGRCVYCHCDNKGSKFRCCINCRRKYRVKKTI